MAEMTVEELKKLMEENGINMSELAKTAKALKQAKESGDEPAKETKIKISKPHTKQWKLIYNEPDIIIDFYDNDVKKKQLVIMMSCNGFYIKTIKTDVSELLNEDNYADFTSGMPELALPDNAWIKTIEGGKRFYRLFEKVISCEAYRNMTKKKIAPRADDYMGRWSRIESSKEIQNYSKYPIIYEEFHDTDKYPKISKLVTKGDGTFICDILDNFGLEKTRDFLQSLEISLLDNTDRYYYGLDNALCSRYRIKDRDNEEHMQDKNRDSCRPRCKMLYERFKEYILYQSIHMGYGDAAKKFIDDWNDCIEMQNQLYGKIKEKYPEHLAEFHNQLRYKYNKYKQIIDEQKFAKSSKFAKRYELKIGDWVFLAPKTKVDFLDEAQQQANCLASYLGQFTDGNTIIMYMRKYEDPEQSWITIEYRNSRIIQAYRAHNVRPIDEENEIINKWCEFATEIDFGTKEPKPIKWPEKKEKKNKNEDEE